MAGSIICLYGGARPICWQLQQRWRVVELLPPVGKLAFQNLSLEPVALPDCVIGVLDGKWRQGDRLALNSSDTERSAPGERYQPTSHPRRCGVASRAAHVPACSDAGCSRGSVDQFSDQRVAWPPHCKGE